MLNGKHISVVIPALNEEQAIRHVVTDLRQLLNEHDVPMIDDIIVCDNGSTDNTAIVAQNCGARVVYESEPGYGAACLAAIRQITATDIVLFVDGDASCDISQAYDVLVPLCEQRSIGKPLHMVIGSRALGHSEPGALTPPQRMGNLVATLMVTLLWRQKITDLGPFRAIRYDALVDIDMQDRRFGWTVEMQIRAIQHGLGTIEVPVDSKRRIGVSKISGTVKGVIGAGIGIIGKILALKWREFNVKDTSRSTQRNPAKVQSLPHRVDVRRSHRIPNKYSSF